MATDSVITKVQSERLIELVREHPYLYTFNDRSYCDYQKKDEAWREIAKKLQVKVQDCKKSWFLLRDSYRRYVRRQRGAKRGLNNVSKRKWRYDVEMSFLLPHLKEKNNGGTNDDINRNNGATNVDIERNIGATNDDIDSNTEDYPDIERALSPAPYITSLGDNESVSEPSTSQIRKSITSDSAEPTETSRRNTSIKTEYNDIQKFFDSLVATVQTFPLRDRAIAKAKVFSVVSQMEIEILNRDQSGYSACMPQSSNEFQESFSYFCDSVSNSQSIKLSPHSAESGLRTVCDGQDSQELQSNTDYEVILPHEIKVEK